MIQIEILTTLGAFRVHFPGNIEELQHVANTIPRFLPCVDVTSNSYIYINLEQVLSYSVVTVDNGPKAEESDEETEETFPDNVRKIFTIRQEDPDRPEKREGKEEIDPDTDPEGNG